MATKTTKATTTAEEYTATEEVKTEEAKAKDIDAYMKETVPYKLPYDRNDNDDVFVSVNDKRFLIKRGVEVRIPRYVAAILDDSQKRDYESFMAQRRMADSFEQEAAKYRV